jgi:phospholipid/cholesterol/gamma-HCH transport system permease protein
MNLIISGIIQVQEITLLIWRVARGIFRSPYYMREMIRQMDVLGYGSLSIILLTGFFTGAVLALNTNNTLQKFGVQSVSGELGSMLVSEQIDAMRALGADPIKKLVTPRIVALVTMAPALTVVCDMIGTMGGMLASILFHGQASSVYIASAKQAVTYHEILGGLIKPTVFGFIIAIIGCYKGLSTTGGTVGVGRSTTQSVVVISILIIAVDFLLMKLILSMLLEP